MARFGINDADNYGNNGGSSFFSLKNDKDTASVRFMYNGLEDVEGYAVHKIEIEGKTRYVNCIREYNEPRSKCPLCNSGNMQVVKLYVPLYDVNAGEIKLWERGKKFFDKLSSICSRYVNGNTPLVAHTFDIERHGKAGDTQTTYEIYETGCDDTRLEDLPEVPDVLGRCILSKTAEDMEFYNEEGYFPNNDGAPKRETREEAPTGRRTPSRRGDNF